MFPRSIVVFLGGIGIGAVVFWLLGSALGPDAATRGTATVVEEIPMKPIADDGGVAQSAPVPKPRTTRTSHTSAAMRSSSGRSVPVSLHTASVSPEAGMGAAGAPHTTPSPEPLRSCAFGSTGVPQRSGIVINEVAWMGSSQNQNAEWIELHNRTNNRISLDGFELVDEGEQVRIALTGIAMNARGFALFERSSDDTVPAIVADAVFVGAIGNTNEGIRLFGSGCVLEDEVLAHPDWSAGENETKRTMERDTNGFGWHTSVSAGGTPRAENSVPVPPPAGGPTPSSSPTSMPSPTPTPTSSPTPTPPPAGGPTPTPTPTPTPSPSPTPLPTITPTPTPSPTGEPTPTPTPSSSPTPTPTPAPTPPPASNVNHLLISEIQLTGGVGATTNDFIELYNSTGQSVDLSGWKLRKRTQSGSESSISVFPAGSAIPAHGFFLWASSDDGYGQSIGANMTTSQNIAANNSIAFMDASGAIVDAVSWGENLTNPFMGSSIGSVLDANQSYERKAWQDSCASAQGSGEGLGNGCDMDNASDFEVRPVSNPQNTASGLEPQG